eukprot:Platyproteum_vivax@DN12458_c0_g1_i1.p1
MCLVFAPPRKVGYGRKAKTPTYHLLYEDPAHNYELRVYPRSRWITTRVLNGSYEAAMTEAYSKLNRYLSGENEEEKQIERFNPVLVQIEYKPGIDKADYVMSCYLAEDNVVRPTNDDVMLAEIPKMVVAVARFTGRVKSYRESVQPWVDHLVLQTCHHEHKMTQVPPTIWHCEYCGIGRKHEVWIAMKLLLKERCV